jgi:hypothetical protein
MQSHIQTDNDHYAKLLAKVITAQQMDADQLGSFERGISELHKRFNVYSRFQMLSIVVTAFELLKDS